MTAPLIARKPRHRDQKLPQLHSEIVITGLELPADHIRRGGRKFTSKFLEALSHLFVL